MTYWACATGGCLQAVVASFVGVDPERLPQTEYPEEMDAWLRRNHGRTLRPVYGSVLRDDAPAGRWIALLARGPSTAHAVIAKHTEIVHDPGAPGWSGDRLGLHELWAKHSGDGLLGYELVRA